MQEAVPVGKGGMLAVLGSQWHLKVADSAILAFDKDCNVFVFISKFFVDFILSCLDDRVHLGLLRLVFGHGLNRRHWLLALLVVQLLVLSALLRCPVGTPLATWRRAGQAQPCSR